VTGDWRDLASFSAWVQFHEALATAPREPGVYVAATGDGDVVYAGMAGPRDRRGEGTAQGLRGRLARYTSGKAIASGLGEAVFDRALEDPAWLAERAAEVAAGEPRRASVWGQLAFERANLAICWSTTPDAATARELEAAVLKALRSAGQPWNRGG